MQGKRIYPENATDFIGFEPGEYGRLPRDEFDPGGIWMCSTPNGILGNLSCHAVTEHEDGTITVSPSILAQEGGTDKTWHGYLEHGVWREV